MRILRVTVDTNYLHRLWTFVAVNLLVSCFFYALGVHSFAVLFLLFANLYLIPLLRLGPLEMTEEYIRHRLPVGCFEIAWDEIERIELSLDETFLVLHGENKKLVISGYNFWSGREKFEVLLLFKHQIEARELKVVQTNIARWQISRGTRVREF